ncbi:MAG: alpha/beta fold hydrolase [Alphaproteobacteria bacterium]|nr:alpha/beta fold hydrolase [Alphaproteobacteria bacterium]
MSRESSPPTRAYRYLRNQLGSLRGVYFQGNSIVRHGDLGQRKETVLLLHGFMQTRAVWEVMEDRLRYDGYGVFSFDLGGLLYRFNTRPIHQLSEIIAEKVEGICTRYDLQHFHIIGHSKGGLIARHYVQRLGGDARVRSLITLGTPHHGTPTALLAVGLFGGGLLSRAPLQMIPKSPFMRWLNRDPFPAQVPLTSIYSRADLVCPYWCSILRPRVGETHLVNREVQGVGHTELCYDPGIYRIVQQRLAEACALWDEREGALPSTGR